MHYALPVIHSRFRRATSLALIFFLAVAYWAVFDRLPQTVFWSPDEGAKFLQLHAYVWEDGPTRRIPYRGALLDPNYMFYPRELDFSHPDYRTSILFPQPRPGGAVEFHWPIWFPLVSKLFFNWWGITGLYIIPLLGGLLTLALVGRLAYFLHPTLAPLSMIIVGLASPVLFYSLLFWEHTLAVFTGLLALWLVIRKQVWWTHCLAGGLLAVAVAIRLEMIVYGAALVLGFGTAWVIQRREKLLALKGRGKILLSGNVSLVFAGAVWMVNSLARGKLPALGILGEKESTIIRRAVERFLAPVFWADVPQRLQRSWIDVIHPGDGPMFGHFYWLGVAGVLICGLAVFFSGKLRNWLLLLGGLCMGVVSVAVLLDPTRYRALHGFFLLSPYLVFAVVALAYARQTNSFPVTFLTATTLLYFTFGTAAAIFGVQGGLEWGPRYLLIGYPLGGICVVLGIYHLDRTTRSALERSLLLSLIVLLLIVGLQYEARGVRELQMAKSDLAAYSEALAKVEQPVVTDLNWLPASLVVRFLAQDMYLIAYRQDLANWLDLVDEHFNSFVFVSFVPLQPRFYKLDRDDISYSLIVLEQQVVRGLTLTELRVVRVY